MYLRLWCLELNAADVVSVDAAMELEHRLLDHMTGSEATLEPVRGLAPALGADAGQLLKVSHAISFIRRRAARYGLGSPDRRDYLAVLFLAVLHALRYAGESPRLAANCRLLVGLAWVLEDVLSCTVGLEPFARDRAPLEPLALLSRRWLAAPGAPGRIAYFLQGPDGRRALEPVAAMRGVAQNDKHHLDVFDHTMLVLAYLETLLEDPVGGLMDPAALDRRTQEHLRRQGIALPDAPRQVPEGKASVDGLEGSLDAIRARFGSLLGSTPDADARLVLKWAALFHDVGKPSARTLNVHPKTGRATVQFLGHEVYGLQIAAEHLHAVFARPCPADGRAMELREGTWVCPRCAESAAAGPGDLLARARRLVLKHHDHHMLVNRYTEHPKFLDSLRAGVRQGRLSQKEASHLADFIDPGKNPYAGDFPLLILHGFADLLSLRGASSESNPLWVAELDLLLLTAFVGWEAIRP